jgi:uncharacterized membrane protein (DUF4010 family)
MESAIVSTLSLALGIGLLIGLQRERAGSDLGGIRTYPLIALFGAVCGVLTAEWGVAIAASGMLAVVALVVLANLGKARSGDDISGQTSEAAAILTYALGALLAVGQYAAAVVVGGVTAVLLHFKGPLHRFAGGLDERDVRAIMRFVIISLVILPLLPDGEFGPYDVLNPREVWLMVVLIVGIGLAGYMMYKIFGGKTGVILGGLLGGLISSTATTVAYARRVGGNANNLSAIAVIIIGRPRDRRSADRRPHAVASRRPGARDTGPGHDRGVRGSVGVRSRR